MVGELSRRDFLSRLGVTLGASAALFPAASQAEVHESTKGRIPATPYKTGHMTFLSGPFAGLGEQSLKGHLLAAEEINARGGLLGKRPIETIKADEAAGTGANVKELRRMKLSESIDCFTGVISSGNTPILGPVAEEIKCLTLFTDGCTDALFEKALPNPHYVFRVTNLQSADGVVTAIATAVTWPTVTKIAHIHSDYPYGRSTSDHFNAALRKLLGKVQVVSESGPKLGLKDFTPHIKKTISARPDLLFCSLWGSDYATFYRQALGQDLFKKMKVATTLAFGAAPHSLGKDHPEGIIAGMHANYHFTVPGGAQWPLNATFVGRFFERWSEYPNFLAEGAYTALYLLKLAIDKANRLSGGWPDDEAIIAMLEGLSMPSPAGYIHIRPDNHQGYKDAVIGISTYSPDFPFPIPDPRRVITVPIHKVTAPPGWPRGDPTSTYAWIEQTWPSGILTP